ncbi:unnamed protein product [Camellia sinensis]
MNRKKPYSLSLSEKMYSFPQPGSVTICEINRDFITAENLSDDRAKETCQSSRIVFSAVSFRTDHLLPSPNPEQGSEQLGRIDESVQRNSWSAALQGIFSNSLKRLFHPNDVKLLPEVDLHGVSWHRHKHILAFISGPNHVTIRDYEDSDSSSFTIWDVAQGRGTPIRRGLGGISMLKWSPTGDYFFAANDGTFYLWETNTWTSEPWSSTSGFVTRSAVSFCAGATWDPDGGMILVAFSESLTLGSVHFASKPPSLVRGIEKIAWDASGDRLALSYKNGDELYKGLIAICDVKRTPLISASLIGPGDNPRPLAFSFHDKFKQGPLLTVVRKIPAKPWKKPIAPPALPNPPRIYKVQSIDFKQVVQKLTGASQSQSRRLQRVAPPPLTLSSTQSAISDNSDKAVVRSTLEHLPLPNTTMTPLSATFCDLGAVNGSPLHPHPFSLLSLFSFSFTNIIIPICIKFSHHCKPMLRKEPIDSRPKLCNVRKERVVSVIVKASSDVDGVAEPPSPSEGEEQAAAVPVENLPLESKLQLDLEKKTKFKLAKKIRLRRKKLVWKRRMRKRGRWPPSKLKKSKNV